MTLDLSKLAQAMILAAESMDRLPVHDGVVRIPETFRRSFTAVIRDTAAELDDLALEVERV